MSLNIVNGAAGIIFVLISQSAVSAPNDQRFEFITAARQLGPAGYRDPLGVISPSGEWFTYSIATRLYVQRVTGGGARELPISTAVIRHIAWLPDSRAIAVDSGAATRRWWLYDVVGGRRPLWEGHESLEGIVTDTGAHVSLSLDRLEQLTWSPDGKKVGGIAREAPGTQLWTLDADGTHAQVLPSDSSLSFPSWSPNGDLACLASKLNRQVITFPCGKPAVPSAPTAYGPITFSPDGKMIYYGSPNAKGELDLWSVPVPFARTPSAAVQRSHFTRDTYAPSTSRDGSVLFKRQDYRTFIASVSAEGGPVTVLTTFQSETPSWDPTGKQIALTFGSWRRALDDLHYPDIAQDLGTIPVGESTPARAPERILVASPSEDQSLCWSPNGKFIAFHSHKDNSDDLWIQPNDGSAPARLLTHFGRGTETSWPRWSPDGRWVLVASYKPGETPFRHVLFLIGVDQQTGATTQTQQEIDLHGFSDEMANAEWLPNSQEIVFQGLQAPDRQRLCRVARTGGTPECFHSFISEHRYPGLGVSPDGKWAVYIAPVGGYYQMFRVPVGGGPAEQLTVDPTNKTQPAYSPDGRQIAFTLWTYEAQFWILRP